jgi:hypothetical protein
MLSRAFQPRLRPVAVRRFQPAEGLHRATRWRLAGGRAYRPSSFGIGAMPGHQEHRRPSTSVPTDARGWRSTARRSIARLVPRPGRRHPAKASRRPARAVSLETTTCPGQWPSADSAVDDELGLDALGPVGLQLGSTGLDFDPPGPHAQRASINYPTNVETSRLLSSSSESSSHPIGGGKVRPAEDASVIEGRTR